MRPSSRSMAREGGPSKATTKPRAQRDPRHTKLRRIRTSRRRTTPLLSKPFARLREERLSPSRHGTAVVSAGSLIQCRPSSSVTGLSVGSREVFCEPASRDTDPSPRNPRVGACGGRVDALWSCRGGAPSPPVLSRRATIPACVWPPRLLISGRRRDLRRRGRVLFLGTPRSRPRWEGRKDRRALLEEACHALLKIRPPERLDHETVGERHRGRQVALVGPVHLALHLREGSRRAVCDEVARVGEGLLQKDLWGQDAIHKAQGKRLFGQKNTTGVKQVKRTRMADQAREDPGNSVLSDETAP